jgi:hypothetical protein
VPTFFVFRKNISNQLAIAAPTLTLTVVSLFACSTCG